MLQDNTILRSWLRVKPPPGWDWRRPRWRDGTTTKQLSGRGTVGGARPLGRTGSRRGLLNRMPVTMNYEYGWCRTWWNPSPRAVGCSELGERWNLRCHRRCLTTAGGRPPAFFSRACLKSVREIKKRGGGGPSIRSSHRAKEESKLPWNLLQETGENKSHICHKCWLFKDRNTLL